MRQLSLAMVPIGTHPAIRDEDLRQWAAVARRLPPHRLDGVHGRAGGAGRPRKEGAEPRRVESRGRGGHGGGWKQERSEDGWGGSIV